jgi:Zn finger protein HypA/HybF involved in hydrogenase expression
MATFWCPSCEATFQQDALSEEGIACPHCLTELHPVVKVADISALRGQPHTDPAEQRAGSPGQR